MAVNLPTWHSASVRRHGRLNRSGFNNTPSPGRSSVRGRATSLMRSSMESFMRRFMRRFMRSFMRSSMRSSMGRCWFVGNATHFIVVIIWAHGLSKASYQVLQRLPKKPVLRVIQSQDGWTTYSKALRLSRETLVGVGDQWIFTEVLYS